MLCGQALLEKAITLCVTVRVYVKYTIGMVIVFFLMIHQPANYVLVEMRKIVILYIHFFSEID